MTVRKYTVLFVGDEGEKYDAITFPHDEKFVEAYVRALSIIEAKNHDYSSETDPFANFRESERFGISAEQGVLIRMSDKFARLRNFFVKGLLKARDESVKDALIDIMNYCAIMYALLEEKNKE